jgi:DNA-binding transcriptional ArsR family regulator
MAVSELRIIVSPRFELFFALAAVLDPAFPNPSDEATARWLTQARRKLDQGFRRRLGALAVPAIWRQLAWLPGAAALDGDTGAAIDAVAQLGSTAFAALTEDAERFQAAAVDVLRRFDRLAFAAFWRMAEPGFIAVAQTTRTAHEDRKEAGETICFPSAFAPEGYGATFESPKGRKTALRFFSVQDPQHAIRRGAPAVPARAPATADPATVFHALGDATRYAIAGLLAREALTSAELARRLGVSPPTLAHHLRALRQARLVIEERRGNSILLRLDRRTLEGLSAAVVAALCDRAQPVAIRRSRRA